MLKRLVKVIKKETTKDKDGNVFHKSYYYIELESGKRMYCSFFGDDSKALARAIACVEYEK